MNIKNKLSTLSLALATALPGVAPLWLPTAASAQTYSTASAASIGSIGVEQVRRLIPGEVLVFTLTGTPGAQVTLQIDGATASLQMSEVQPGRYAGEYVVRLRDRLSAASTVTATVVKDGRTTSAALSRSLVLGAPDPVAAVSSQITAFNVTAPDRLRRGDEMSFSLTGPRGGNARVVLQGVDRPIALREVSRGVYEGTYVVARGDNLRDDWVADAYLVVNKRESTQRFQHDANGGYNQGRNGRNDKQPYAAACATCGSVEAVNVVEVKGDSPNVIGTIAGGVLGGVVGNQVGGGSGKDLATILGAVGGAYAGNRVESNMGKTKVFRVTVRLEGGTTQDFDYAADPSITVGTRVKVENGVLVRR